MTSVNGYHVVSAPCCQRKYSSLAYSSINTRNWHRWSDGFAFGDLYKPTSKICRCDCGAYFFADDVETLEYVRFKDAPDQRPPPLPRLSWSDCLGVMENGQTFCNEAIECEIRLLYWRCLNHRYRKRADQDEYAPIFADLNDGPPRPIPLWQLTDTECDRRITENLEVLYPLIVRHHPDAQFLLGEACREAGRMNDAIEHYKQVLESDEAAAEHLIVLAKAKSTRVIRIEPPDWIEPQQKPEPWRRPFLLPEHQEIQSRDYWFKIFGMLNQVWVLIDKPDEGCDAVAVFHIDDNSKIINLEVFKDEATARARLIEDGYKRYDDSPDVWSFMVPPGGPFGF